MKRTTIMADEELLERLRDIAHRDRISLAEVIRQGLEIRAAQEPRRPRFIGAGASEEPPHDTSERVGELQFELWSWR